MGKVILNQFNWISGFSKYFYYTGEVESYIIPRTGLYQLEVWGAQGGSVSTTPGGYGGYSKGYKLFQKGDIIYICCGEWGHHTATQSNTPAYNGGGASGDNSGSQSMGGGGCTHMALITGTLASIGASNLSQVLLVAGGGGGGVSACTTYRAGDGGGVVGGQGFTDNSSYCAAAHRAEGGTQTGPGAAYENASRQGVFGAGIQTNTSGWGGGGGGGLYGGSNGHGTLGAGGSGYIGGVPEILYKNITWSPVTALGGNSTSGNGYAKITFITD